MQMVILTVTVPRMVTQMAPMAAVVDTAEVHTVEVVTKCQTLVQV
jgi:hypothetical protein